MSRVILARRVAVAVAALVVLVLVVAAIVGVTYVRRPFPTTQGELTLDGLAAPVTVLRDERGIPQIYADSATDLFTAQGFVHAQDRFFEMDLRRHITAGRLSELVGEGGLETDRVIRTLGWRRVAEAELPTLKPETRQYFQAYADGVNAYLDRNDSPSSVALEYTVLSQSVSGYRIEPWTAADSLAWLKAMAWDLRGDYENELMRARLFGRIPTAQINEIFPPYPFEDHEPILSAQDWAPTRGPASAVPAAGTLPAAAPPTAAATAPVAAPLAATLVADDVEQRTSTAARQAYAAAGAALASVPVMFGRGDGIGSNSWAVGPARSSTGKPLLANDPHLGTGIPGIWYQVGLHCNQVSDACPFDVAGYSLAGTPGVVIGHNQQIAWGMTNLGPDVTDFYLEQVRGQTYQRDGKYVPLESRRETIKVAGGEDQTITVRETVHGPIISDVIDPLVIAGANAPVSGRENAGSYDVSLAWTGLLVSQTADAIFGLNTATTFEDFREAARDFAVPSQNLIYADRDGHIGYQAPGRIPVRRSDTPGAVPGYWPIAGWRSSWDWKDFVPFEQMPWVLDPAEGLLVTANQPVTSGNTPFLTTQWDYGYRAQRIRALLEAEEKVTPERMAQIQGDTRNEFAPRLVKVLLDTELEGDEFTREAQDLLRGWDFTNPVGNSEAGAAAAYYNAVWAALMENTFNDELPDDLRADGGDRWMHAVAVLLEKPESPWWDDKLTPGVTEGMSEVLRRSLVDARLQLTQELGKDPASWEWGKLHQLDLEHAALGGEDIPGVVRRVFNRGPVALPGGSSIVNANGWNASEGFTVDWAPSMRMVVDLGDLDRSRWVNQTGNSGHAFHDNYDDQTATWAANELYPWPFSRDAVRDAGGDELRLVPSATQ